MSDMPMNGKGYMSAATDPIRKNASIFNPMDLAMMKEEGAFTGMENMTARQAFEQFCSKVGINPDGPVQQLVEFGRKQVENGDMLGKMQNISQEGNEEEPLPTPGLEDLMKERSNNV